MRTLTGAGGELGNVTVTAIKKTLDSWGTRISIYTGGLLSTPVPKKWLGMYVARNAASKTSLISYAMGQWKKPINFMGKRRLYTHTLNGSKRTASTWGRFAGRWTTRILGRAASVYFYYEFAKYVAVPMAEGMGQYQESNRISGNWIANLPH